MTAVAERNHGPLTHDMSLVLIELDDIRKHEVV